MNIEKVYEEKDYRRLKKEYCIEGFNFEIDSLNKFIENGLILGHWGLNKIKLNKHLAIVSGFSLSGKLHLGNKLCLDVATQLKKYGAKVFVPLSDTEASLTRRSPKDINKEFRLFVKDIIKSEININEMDIYLHSTNKEVQSLFLKILKNSKIAYFRNIYGAKIDLPYIFAILNMMADIFYPLEKDYRQIVVILGIDEIKHAQLVNLLSKKLGLVKPSFIFLKMLNGLKKSKMSKSRVKENILVSDKPSVAKSKLIKFSIKRRFKNVGDDSAYQIASWYLNIPKSKLNKILKNLSYKEFIKYIANELERYFKNEFKI